MKGRWAFFFFTVMMDGQMVHAERCAFTRMFGSRHVVAHDRASAIEAIHIGDGG